MCAANNVRWWWSLYPRRSVPEPRIYLGIAAGAPELSSCDIDIHNIWIRNLSAKKLQSLGSLLTKPPTVQTFVDMQPNFQCESCRTSSAVPLSLSMYINVTDGDLYGWLRRCCCILHLDTDLKFSGPAPGRKYQRCCLYRTLTSNCCSQIESATYEHDMITYGPGPGCLVPGSGSMLIYLILIINSSLTPELGWAVPCPCHAKWRG